MSTAVVCRGCGVRVAVPDRAKAPRCPKCKAALRPAPPAEPPLSLDDAEQVTPPAPPTPAPPAPFRFAAKVIADSSRRLRGDFAVVLLPHGLYLESVPNQPFLFAPVGTPAEVGDPRELTLTLPDRVLVLRVAGVGNPEALAADAADFLAERRPVPVPADYLATPRTAVVLPVVLAVVLSSAVAAGLLFAFGGFGKKPEPERVESPPPAAEKPAPVEEPPAPPPPAEPPPRPRTHLDVLKQDGATRLDDGPADVTAVAALADNVVVVGHADGATRVWALDRPAFDAPRDGPRADGPVQRIQASADGQTLYLTCNGGFTAGARDAPPKTPVKLLGEMVAVLPEAGAEQFAALRGGRIVTRFVPTAVVKDPSVSIPVKGFVLPVSTLEKPVSAARPSLTPPVPKPTFLAWHPAGKLLAGTPSGEVVTWAAGATPASLTKLHSSPVTAWADGWPHFVTADAGGVVGVWANKSLTPTTFKTTGGPVAALAVTATGDRVAVLGPDGVSVWTVRGDPVKRVPGPARAVAFGPDGVLLIGDGKGVRVVK